MERPPEPPQAASPRVGPGAILRLLEERRDDADDALTALLVVRLSPSDRAMVALPEAVGSRVLDEIDHRIRTMLRPGDCFAFASREEVWLLLRNLRGEALAQLAANSLANRLRRVIEAPGLDHSGDLLSLRPAVGVAWVPPGVRARPQEIVAAASEAATLVLDDEDPIVIRKFEVSSSGVATLQLEDEIRRALADNALEMHFQPQLDLRSGRVHAAEALVRWPAEHKIRISPQTIATVCEERGMIGELTRFTVNASLRHMAGWRTRGLDVTIGINLSAEVMSDSSTPQTVATALATWGIPADRVTLELTETALIDDRGTARAVMLRLHELGCGLSIDDFGTGYSPFTYLRNFPLNELKIDQAFTRKITEVEADRKIVTSLIELAHAFDLRIVAEGVEDEATRNYLQSVDCDLIQGWYLAKAMPAGTFAEWCLAYNAGSAG